MDNREIGPGDIVYDETEKRSSVIRRIKNNKIFINNGEPIVFQDDEWKSTLYPDHILSFRPAPGNISLEGLETDHYSKFLLQIEVLYGEDPEGGDDWRVGIDGRILFNSKEEAIAYYESFGRQYLELGPYGGKSLEGCNQGLYKAWGTQYPADHLSTVSELIVYHADQLRDTNTVEMHDDPDTYRITIIEVPYMSGNPMIKSTLKR